MRITRLRIQGLRRHTDLELRPAPGLTVIRGPNEAGKSTVQQAIELILFRRPTWSGAELSHARTWASDADPRIELDFDHEGMAGRLVKVFGGARGTVELDLDGDVERDPAQVEARIADLTGLPSEKFFRSTASVRHAELEMLDRDEGALRDRLQLSMSGADRGTWMAKRALAESIRRYRSEGTRNPGRLKSVTDELARLRADLAAGEAALTRLEADRAALAVAHDRRATLDAQAARDQEALDAAERIVKLAAGQEDARSRYERYRNGAELLDRVRAAEASHPSRSPLPELKTGVQRVKELQFSIEELNSNLESEPQLTDDALEVPQAPRWQPIALIAITLLIGAMIALGVTAAFPQVGLGGIGIAIGLAVMSLIAIGVTWRLLRRARHVRVQGGLQEAEIQRRLRGRSDEQDRLKAVRRERDALLTSLGIIDVYAGQELLDAEMEHVASIDRLRAELKGVLGDTPPTEELAQLRDRAAADVELAAHALAGMGDVGGDPQAIRLRAAGALRSTQLLRETALREEGQAQGRVDHNEVDAEQVAALSEAVLGCEERLATLERQVRIYEATLTAIGEAERATMKKAARYLEQHMGQDVALITDDRYRRVRVDEQTLTFTVWSSERGDWVPALDLSKGTIDQLYLAARLGLVRQVTQERRPPLIFDDPFVTFDDARALRAVALLKQLAADHQVLYLTTSARYDSLADGVVILPAPTARDHDPDAPAAPEAPSGVPDPGIAPSVPDPGVAPVPDPGVAPGTAAAASEPATGGSDVPADWSFAGRLWDAG